MPRASASRRSRGSTRTSRSIARCTTRSPRSTSSAADADTQRFIAHTLRDYRRAGVDKPPEVRERLKQIDEELTQARPGVLEEHRRGRPRDRDHAIRRGSPACRPTSSRRTSPTTAASIRITTDYPDYNPFMTYADDDELRKRALHRVPQPRRPGERARAPDILALRAEKARCSASRTGPTTSPPTR